jgi:hypothetical protein
MGVDPWAATHEQIRAAISQVYPLPHLKPGEPDRDADRSATKIKRFVEVATDDLVLICKGYPANANAPVHIYGYARVNGPFRIKRSGEWPWLFKHKATLQRVELDVPKQVVVGALHKLSLLETIHKLELGTISSLAKAIGVLVQV